MGSGGTLSNALVPLHHRLREADAETIEAFPFVRLSVQGPVSELEAPWFASTTASSPSTVWYPGGRTLTSHRIEILGNFRRAPIEAHLRLETAAAVVATSVLGAAVLGVTLSISLGIAVTLVGFVVLLAVVARVDLLGIGVILTATLPWLIALSELLPRLTVTFVAGATAVVVALIAMPRSDGSKISLLLRLGMILFFAPVVISLARDGSSIAFIQAAKYVVFPLMVMVVTEATNRADLVRLRAVALWSSVAAVTVNLVMGLSGIANISYYESGEVLGFGAAHTLALLAGCLVAASLASQVPLTSAPVIALGSIATVATGVRSALPGLALVMIARMLSGRLRFRVMVLVALAVVGIFASGASDVVEARFHRSNAQGEFQSFSNLGSGRGAIYSAAIEGWRASSPANWVVGTGLRSIGRFEEEKLGHAFVGHSDVIEVGVQLGIIGLIGLILMWRVLIERADSRLPLFVLGSFALFSGLLEYSGAVVVGLILTAGLRSHPEPVRNAGVPETRVPYLPALALSGAGDSRARGSSQPAFERGRENKLIRRAFLRFRPHAL